MKKTWKILGGTFLIVACFLMAKAVLYPKVMEKANYGMANMRHLQEVDHVFVGSSMFRQGIDISSIHGGEGGETAYLLAYNGNQPVMEFKEIQYLLDSGVRIGTLYVDMYAYALSAEPSLSDLRIVQGMPLSFVLDVCRTLSAYGDLSAGDVYELLVQANNELFVTSPISMPLINSRYDRGGNMGRQAGRTREELAGMVDNIKTDDAINAIQAESLRELVALCKAHGIRVIFIETPKYALNYAKPGYAALMRDYYELVASMDCEAILSNATAESAGIDGATLYEFDSERAEYFTDLIHMSYDGRACFSAILSEMI